MSWTDKESLRIMQDLKKEFNIRFFIETGTFKGINAIVHSKDFDYVFTCENNLEYVNISEKKIYNISNVYLFHSESTKFLEVIKNTICNKDEVVFIYLDAHFYNPNLPLDKRFTVIDELKVLNGMKNCIICIHDFWNDKFTGLTYDNIKLDFELLKMYLEQVNPNFKYYTNSKCDVYNETNIKELIDDKDALDNIKYANSSIEKRDRGMLYCIPKEVNIDSLVKI